MGHFFSSPHLSGFFFAVSSENISPIYCFGHSSSQSVSQWKSLSPLKYLVYKCNSCFRPEMGQFFSSSHLSTPCHTCFAVSLENIYPIYSFVHSLSQSVTQWNSIFSFKILCLQMLHLFQTRDGPFFFHRHTCLHLSRFFYAVSSKNICPKYCFGHSSSQSV